VKGEVLLQSCSSSGDERSRVERKGEPEICNSVLPGSGRSDGVAVMPDPTAAAPPMVQREAPFALKLSKGVLFSFRSSTNLHDVLAHGGRSVFWR